MQGDELRAIFERTRTIAILGAHPEPMRAAHYVPVYLAQVGFVVLPVNPAHAGSELFGRRVVATLGEVDEHVDLVDVFRRSDAVHQHVEEILALSPRPATVWLQLGIRDDVSAARLRAEGIDVVQDRCTLADHRRLYAGA